MRCPKFRNHDVRPGTKHKRGVKGKGKETFCKWELSPKTNLIWDHYTIMVT